MGVGNLIYILAVFGKICSLINFFLSVEKWLLPNEQKDPLKGRESPN